MSSAGNDIVALHAINITRTKQLKFYSKILSAAEKELYARPGFEAIPFENYVWLLWSIKESAYKYLKRQNPALIFTPVKFEVKQLQVPAGYQPVSFNAEEITGVGFADKPAIKGIITVGDITLYSRSLIYNELLMSVVNQTENFDSTHWGIKRIDNFNPDNQSLAVRTFVTDKLQKLLDIHTLSVAKSEPGIPVLLNGEVELTIPVSLSHHENFVAYSFQFANQ